MLRYIGILSLCVPVILGTNFLPGWSVTTTTTAPPPSRDYFPSLFVTSTTAAAPSTTTAAPPSTTAAPPRSMRLASPSTTAVPPSTTAARPAGLWAEYGAWGEWSPCSVTCGGGFTARMRMCLGGPMCASLWDVDAGVCGEEECPPKVPEWGEWSVCEDGWHYRERCDHNYDCDWEEEECVMPYKKVTKVNWSAWGECHEDEHLEVRVRSRDRCSLQFGCEEEVEECEEKKDIPKDFGTWGQWGSCENGLRSRFKCSGVNKCTEEEIEECFSNLWSSWGLCKKGLQERSKCDKVTGCQTEQRACGGALLLESWSSWSPCVEGFTSREKCTEEGYDCLYEDRECRTDESEWSEWTRCREGVREREKCSDTECQLELQDCQESSGSHCTQDVYKKQQGRFIMFDDCIQDNAYVSETYGIIETLGNVDWYDPSATEEDTDVMWDIYEL